MQHRAARRHLSDRQPGDQLTGGRRGTGQEGKTLSHRQQWSLLDHAPHAGTPCTQALGAGKNRSAGEIVLTWVISGSGM